MSLNEARSDLLAGAAGVLALLILVFAVRLPFWIGIVAAAAIYGGARFLIPPPKEAAPGVSKADVARVRQEGKDRVGKIRALAQQIQKSEVRAQVLRIAGISDNIYADFVQRPKDINSVPDFATTYLDPLINVLNRYVRLASVESGAGKDQSLGKIETDLLPKVESNFDGLYRQLSQDDVVDLDAASEGLKALLDLGST